MPRPRVNSRTGSEPYECLLVGPYYFLPWETVVAPCALGATRVDRHHWRSPGGQKVSAEQIYAWAERRGYEVRRHYHVPRLIDEAEEADIDRILYE